MSDPPEVDPAIPREMDERFAFDVADTSGDGYVSEGELTREAAAAFSSLDQDHSGTLTPQELGVHDAWFAAVDSNGDGVLTLVEVVTYKTQGFKAGDKNHDGLLSYDEMIGGVKVEKGVQ